MGFEGIKEGTLERGNLHRKEWGFIKWRAEDKWVNFLS